MTRIKICGLKREEEIDYVNHLRPEYIGFVFVDKSKRYLPVEQAFHLKKLLDPQIRAVGVFANAAIEQVVSYLAHGVIDLVQLHGDEDYQYIKSIKALTDKPVIKAYPVNGPQDIDKAINSTADYILLDHGNGGTGESFDWSLASGINRQFFLAGGLSAGNVKAAILKCNPYAVDASSALETDGQKDYSKLFEFIGTVRGGK